MSAQAVARQLGTLEQAMLDVLVGRFNEEISRVIKYVTPGNNFTVALSNNIEIQGQGDVRPTNVVMNAVADSFRSQGWAVDQAVVGGDFGVAQLTLVRPPRETPLTPSVTPISGFHS